MAEITRTKDGGSTCVTLTYYSLDEYADAAAARPALYKADESNGMVDLPGAVELAKTGWHEPLAAMLDLAEDAVKLCDREHEMQAFQPAFDVAGSDVEIGRYLAGEPECMVDYPLTVTSKVGRVITLCASVSYSGSILPDALLRRGTVITALALALMRLGHSVELWADSSALNLIAGKPIMRQRVLVKGASDVTDPERIAFAYAHPAMLRQLGFAIETRPDIDGLRGACPEKSFPVPPRRDLPEGTIYLPELRSGSDLPDADKDLVRYLTELGLIAS